MPNFNSKILIVKYVDIGVQLIIIFTSLNLDYLRVLQSLFSIGLWQSLSAIYYRKIQISKFRSIYNKISGFLIVLTLISLFTGTYLVLQFFLIILPIIAVLYLFLSIYELKELHKTSKDLKS